MNIIHRCSTSLFKFLLVTTLLVVTLITGWGSTEFTANADASVCNTVTKINGMYHCSGKCVTSTGERKPVSDEKDVVEHLHGENDSFYRVDIENGSFHEVEVGPLVGSTLRTATAQVSDNQFPVLEEYIFDKSDLDGYAQGFTKIVRNPSKENFKSCVLYCEKIGELSQKKDANSKMNWQENVSSD